MCGAAMLLLMCVQWLFLKPSAEQLASDVWGADQLAIVQVHSSRSMIALVHHCSLLPASMSIPLFRSLWMAARCNGWTRSLSARHQRWRWR